MVIIIAIIVGVLISRYYEPQSKSQKIWASVLIPLISGVFINLVAVAFRNPEYGFAFNYGATFPPIAIFELVLFVTLLISLKVDKKADVVEEPITKLYYGTGENRVEFEMNLSEQEITLMEEMQKKDPDKWKDNDWELLRYVRRNIVEKQNNDGESEKQEIMKEEKNVEMTSNEKAQGGCIDEDLSNDETTEKTNTDRDYSSTIECDNRSKTKTQKGIRVLLAIVACVVLFLLFGLLAASLGLKHGGGAIVMFLFLSFVAFVWRKILGKKENPDENFKVSLHNGVGEERFDFEVMLTQDEILQMSKVRGQNPEKWKDNEYELVKIIIPDFRIEELEKRGKNVKINQPDDTAQTIKLRQDGIEVSMSLPFNVIEQMERIREQNPQKWENNEVELVREAKKQVASIVRENSKDEVDKVLENELKPETVITSVDVDTHQEPSVLTFSNEVVSQPVLEVEKPRPSESMFGNKLESEYRRESKTEAHWIRQDDTEIYINIEESVYRKMVELQSENPKKWVNKELDLFQKAKNMLFVQKTPKWSFLKKR